MLNSKNKPIRIVCKANYIAHTDPLFKKMNILKAVDLFEVNSLKIYHNHLHGKVPEYISGLFQTANHGYNTRFRGLTIVRTSTTGSSKRLKCLIPKLLNKLPDHITNKLITHSLQGFKNYLKKIKLDGYNSICTDRNCFSCQRIS